MKYEALDQHTYVIRLEKGESLQSCLFAFCKKTSVGNALFWGIGSVEDPLLAHYRVDTKKYSDKRLSGIFELVNLTGTVAKDPESSVMVHMHATISDEEMQMYGGHLVDAVVSATVEIVLKHFSTSFEKVYDQDIGLK